MKITFGKYKGWDTKELAMAGEEGRNYLKWGSEKLQSPMWRKEFTLALSANVKADKNLVKDIIRSSEDYLDEDDLEVAAEAATTEYNEKIQRDARFRAALNVVIAKYSKILGLPEARLKALAMKYAYGEQTYGEKQFSSRQKYMDFDGFIKEFSSVEY